MGWKSSNGQPVVIEATGLYIDGEFLEDDAPTEAATRSVPYAGDDNESQ